MQTTRKMHKYVLRLVGVWLLLAIAYPTAYMRVATSQKFSGQPFKSMTWRGEVVSNK